MELSKKKKKTLTWKFNNCCSTVLEFLVIYNVTYQQKLFFFPNTQQFP